MSYPDDAGHPYGEAAFGAAPRGPTLDDLRLTPPIHIPDRLADLAVLGREPTPADVRLHTTIGGIPASMPLVIPAMGSTPFAHRHGIPLARAAAKHGIPLVLGENIASVHGYDERSDFEYPSFKERALAYLDELARMEAQHGADDGRAGGQTAHGEESGDGPEAISGLRQEGPRGLHPGGLVIQQSVEDAMDELWWRIYTDPDFQDAIEAGRIGFEVKVGQGAKPGLGGLTFLTPEQADRLEREYHIDRKRRDGRIERFSAPGTFTYDILEAQLRHLANDFPKVHLWVKLPPCRDIMQAAHAVARGGAELVTLDGAEAGTALAPTVFLEQVGLPTMALLAHLRRNTPDCDLLLSGGIRDAGHQAKALALGCQGVAMGRRPLQTVVDEGEEGVAAWFDEMAGELAKITYAMGHLDVRELDEQDVQALDPALAQTLGIACVFDPPPEAKEGIGITTQVAQEAVAETS